MSTNNSSNNSALTENWIPVRAIENNMIMLDNKYMVTGVKIQPKNIFISDELTQANVIESFKTFYNLIDYEFWIVCADRPVDINIYMSQLQLQLNDTQDPIRRKLIYDDIRKAETFVNNEVVDTEFYILFKDNNNETIQKRVRGLINGLASCSLVASQVSNEDLRVIVDNFLNGGKTFENRTVIG